MNALPSAPSGAFVSPFRAVRTPCLRLALVVGLQNLRWERLEFQYATLHSGGLSLKSRPILPRCEPTEMNRQDHWFWEVRERSLQRNTTSTHEAEQWSTSRKQSNRAIHATHGNIPPLLIHTFFYLLIAILLHLMVGNLQQDWTCWNWDSDALKKMGTLQADWCYRWASSRSLNHIPRKARRAGRQKNRTLFRKDSSLWEAGAGLITCGFGTTWILCYWMAIIFNTCMSLWAEKNSPWSISRKVRNRRIRALNGNHRFVTVNIQRKGLMVVRKILSKLDPDLMVVTEPGDVGARPQIRGFNLIRHKNIVVCLREKTTTLVSHESLWEKPQQPGPPAGLANNLGIGEDTKEKKKVRFQEPLLEKDKEKMKDERILKTTFRMGKTHWTLISIYGPQRGDETRKSFWEKLDETFLKQPGPLQEVTCVAGDFNALAETTEAIGLSSADYLAVPQMKKWHEERRLLDVWRIHSSSVGITRFKPGGSYVGSRLDRFLITLKTQKVVQKSAIRVGDKVSDHAMLVWDFGMVSDCQWRKVIQADNAKVDWGKWSDGTRKLWTEWMNHQTLLDEITTSASPHDRFGKFQTFWKKCRARAYDILGAGSKIKRLSKAKAAALKERNTEKERKLCDKMKEDLKRKILRKKRGEGNREVFALQNETGQWLEGDDLENFVAKALQNFGHRKVPDQDPETRERLLAQEIKELLEPPTFPEYLETLCKMKKKKACLEDDLPPWIIKESGERMQKACYEMIRDAWTHPEEIPNEWKKTVIRLIPKQEKDPSLLTSWRPIAVGTTLHKIIFMIWSKRLERMALKKRWIHPNQFGFTKGRTAKGAADVASSHIENLRNPVVLQWDLERAFPSISPEAISSMLQNLSVPKQFCDIFLHFYTNAHSEAIVAGLSGGANGNCRWMNEWGLRQGCPASPLLLNLWTFPIVDAVSRHTKTIQYADDLWAFLEEEDEEKIKRLVVEQVRKTGMVVNEEKISKWTPSSPACLLLLGMVIREGRVEKMDTRVDKVLGIGIARGIERELTGWKRVVHVNSVILARLRYLLGTCWSMKLFREAQEIDEVIRTYVKREWPRYIDNDFVYDEGFGLGVKSLEVELAKDLLCYVWNLAEQGPDVLNIWKSAWDSFVAGGSPSRIILWKEAVEMVTDTSVERDLYQPGQKNPFPFESTGHYHKSTLQTPFILLPKEQFEVHGCSDAWESINNPRALRVWTDGSVVGSRGAAAVLIEGSQFSPTSVNKWDERVKQKAGELGLNLQITQVDPEYEGRVQGKCGRCGKPFDVYIRTFLSRGPNRCGCQEEKVGVQELVLRKAREVGKLKVVHVDSDRTGKVRGACEACGKEFDVFIRTFLYRGPTKCSCHVKSKTTETEDENSNDEESGPTTQPQGQPLVRKTISLPSSVYTFPTRGDSFRSESLGILGAKQLLLLRGNAEGKEELHFLTDSKSNVELMKDFQRNPQRPVRNRVLQMSKGLDENLLKQWRSIKYIFVKGHIGIPQNEICDSKARNEALRCTETILEEALKNFGEVRQRGKVAESRKELLRERHWMEHFHLGIMSCCRTRMAKRVQLGIERWKGNDSVFSESREAECSWCKGCHKLSFFDFISTCPLTRTFRKEIEARWESTLRDVAFDSDLLFGKVKKTLFQRVCRKGKGVDEKHVWRDFCSALKWWEKKLHRLRQNLEAQEEEDSDGSDKEVESKESKLAKGVRVMDVGVVKKGEPEIFLPQKGRQELKRFLSQKQ